MSKILLVEDDYNLGNIIKDQLEMNGYSVSLTRIPSEVLHQLKENKFDLVILDKLLSGMDGTHICREIRNTDNTSSTPVLMMSGYDGARDNCIAAGATDFIAKPFAVDCLLQSIESTIKKKKNLKE